MNVSEWINKDSSYVCDDCGHETEIRALGGDGLKLTCENYDCDCYPACTLLISKYDGEKVSYEFPSGEIGEYQCPECSSKSVERTPYDDGAGQVDVKLECQECGESTWE